MIETKRKKTPKKNNVVVSLIKALSEKSADAFQNEISTGTLYKELKPEKKN